MIRSDSFAAIAAAIVKAQQLIGGAQKNAVNPHLKNKYANLEAVWDAVSPALEACKLAVLQSPQPSEDSKLHLETMIIHESGEFISGVLVMPLPKQDPQGYGSALTYARRYHLSSMLSVVQDDDDATTASKGSPTAAAEEIAACDTMESLESAFKEAFVKFRENPAAIRVITDAKDTRKAQLATASVNGESFNPAKLQKEKPAEPQNNPKVEPDSTPIEEF